MTLALAADQHRWDAVVLFRRSRTQSSRTAGKDSGAIPAACGTVNAGELFRAERLRVLASTICALLLEAPRPGLSLRDQERRFAPVGRRRPSYYQTIRSIRCGGLSVRSRKRTGFSS